MERVTKRDLNQQTATVLERVTASGDVIVTERGKPRWRVSAYQGDDGLARLEREGLYEPPVDQPAAWPARPGGPRYSDNDVEALLQEMRGEY